MAKTERKVYDPDLTRNTLTFDENNRFEVDCSVGSLKWTVAEQHKIKQLSFFIHFHQIFPDDKV